MQEFLEPSWAQARDGFQVDADDTWQRFAAEWMATDTASVSEFVPSFGKVPFFAKDFLCGRVGSIPIRLSML